MVDMIEIAECQTFHQMWICNQVDKSRGRVTSVQMEYKCNW